MKMFSIKTKCTNNKNNVPETLDIQYEYAGNFKLSPYECSIAAVSCH